jgi:hypothetical protein
MIKVRDDIRRKHLQNRTHKLYHFSRPARFQSSYIKFQVTENESAKKNICISARLSY